MLVPTLAFAKTVMKRSTESASISMNVQEAAMNVTSTRNASTLLDPTDANATLVSKAMVKDARTSTSAQLKILIVTRMPSAAIKLVATLASANLDIVETERRSVSKLTSVKRKRRSVNQILNVWTPLVATSVNAKNTTAAVERHQANASWNSSMNARREQIPVMTSLRYASICPKDSDVTAKMDTSALDKSARMSTSVKRRTTVQNMLFVRIFREATLVNARRDSRAMESNAKISTNVQTTMIEPEIVTHRALSARIPLVTTNAHASLDTRA